MGSRGLGINKDLEPLVRRVRREGGTVEVTASTHVRWTMPDGQVLTTGLTMNSRSARRAQRAIEAALDRPDANAAPGAQEPAHGFDVEPTATGKYVLVHAQSREPVCNANGYPRTFSTPDRALAARSDLAQTGH